MHKTADFHSNLLVAWELVTGGYQGRPVLCISQVCLDSLQSPIPKLLTDLSGNQLFCAFHRSLP